MFNYRKNRLLAPFRRSATLIIISSVIMSIFLLAGARNPPSNDAELISIGLDGKAGSGDNYYVSSEITSSAISADGRYVVFSSLAENLTSDDVSGWHIYLRDREAATTTLVADGSYSGGNPVISADGEYIAFSSLSSGLVTGDNNGSVDIFVYERVTGQINRVSVSSGGSEAAGCSCGWPDYCNGCEYDNVNSHPSISGDGRYIAFTSFSSNFVSGDLDDTPDVFIHDQQTGETTIISRASDGNLGNAGSGEPSISADGNSIAFSSSASNLVTEDWNNQQDVFLWRRGEPELVRVSVATDGSEGNSTSTDPVISADGTRIAFTSGATSLSNSDTNGFIYDVFLHEIDKGTTSILSSGLAGGGDWPAISGNGQVVGFNSGTNDIYLSNIEADERFLVNDNMQFSSLDNSGETLVLSGYANLVPEDTNGDKDVYVVSGVTTAPPPGDDTDTDGDGVADDTDPDDDNDGVPDIEDAFPLDPEKSTADTSSSSLNIFYLVSIIALIGLVRRKKS